MDIKNEVYQASNLVQVRKRLKRITKKLVLLKTLKSRNHRIKLLCELAHKYQRDLSLTGSPDVSASGPSVVSEDYSSCKTNELAEPFMDIEVSMDKEVEPEPEAEVKAEPEPEPEAKAEAKAEAAETAEVAKADPFPETSGEASSTEFQEALCLKGLPRRFRMPAPRVLCRPSALRWIKPCCTRSCNESLEHVITIHYSKYQKSHSVSSQTSIIVAWVGESPKGTQTCLSNQVLPKCYDKLESH